jgi:alpha-1,3/alpha-1,6-mannosyltransferase
LKASYRYPLDWLEEKTTGMANTVLVNSKFTAETYANAFKSLTNQPAVLYPSLNFKAFDAKPDPPKDWFPPSTKTVFLSINRYERKKNLVLALKALNELKSRKEVSDTWESVHLIMAGGYDDQVVENVEHYSELREFTTKNHLDDHVTFLRSFSGAEKLSLLNVCNALVYTPSNEHFGICPLEAMYMQRPVIAVNSGGPLESVVHGQTGFLCEPTPEAFADAMVQIIHNNPERNRYMGKMGHQQVVNHFSFEAFTSALDKVVTKTLEIQK